MYLVLDLVAIRCSIAALPVTRKLVVLCPQRQVNHLTLLNMRLSIPCGSLVISTPVREYHAVYGYTPPRRNDIKVLTI